MMGNKQQPKQSNSETNEQKQVDKKEDKIVPQIPSNAETLIIVLGQCLLETGEPDPWIIDRVNKAYSLLAEYNLNISTTYFIVSGSDVSNFHYQRKYGELPKPKHISEA
eukprot:397325_1